MLQQTFLRGASAALVLAAMPLAAQQTYDPMKPVNTMPAAPADPMAVAPAAPDSGAAAPDPELGGLPAGEGAEDTYYQCVACHSIAIVKQQHLTDARWDYLWTWMVEDQGMYEPDDETRQRILTYLKTHFSSER